MTTPPNQEKPTIGRASWEFTYTGQVLAEVAKKRIEELNAQIEPANKSWANMRELEKKLDPMFYHHSLPPSLEILDKIKELRNWIFTFEKHPENKFDLNRDDFIYFFKERNGL